MVYRKYRPSDCEKIAELFYQTVHSVNQKDYTPEQLDAWATGQVDLVQWNRTLSDHYMEKQEPQLFGSFPSFPSLQI